MKQIKNGVLYVCDCIEAMESLPDHSVDMVLCDLPYGTTANSWDAIIPFDALWKQWMRVAKPACPFVLTASQPFTTDLINSNRAMFRYCLVWDKTKGGGFVLAKKQPMKSHEDVVVFYKQQPTYNPQMEVRGKPRKKGGGKASPNTGVTPTVSYNNEYYPKSIMTFSTGSRVDKFHPTQKPVELFEYLIRTYTNKGDVVLDCCSGSGTTAVAAEASERKWICIEKDVDFADKSALRIADAKPAEPVC
jgi:site-specific DNA-methyltransferase (adenine-specific)